MRRRHKAGNNFDDINEFETMGLLQDENSHRNESASLPRNFPRQVSGRFVDNAGFEINNQISYQRSVSHMNEYNGEDEMYAIVDTTTVTLQQSLILHTQNATTGNQPNCCVAQCSCGNPNCNLGMSNGNLCTSCGAVTVGCIVHEAPPYITLPRTRVDGALENMAPNNVLLAHQNVYSTGPRHFARRPLCSVINAAPMIDPMGQLVGGNLQYGFPVAQNYPPLVLCSCNNSLTTGIQNAGVLHPAVLQCNVPVTVTTSQQVVLQVSQAVSTVQSSRPAEDDTRSNYATLRRGSRPRIAGPETVVTVSQQESPRISTRQEANRTPPVRAPENRSNEPASQLDSNLTSVTLHNNIDSQSGTAAVRSVNECRSLSPDRNLIGQNLDTDSSCDESAGSCISMIQPKYSTLPWNFVCRPKKQPNTEKIKKNLPIPDRQVNTVPRRQNSARSQLKSLWQKLRKSWTRALEDETNVNLNTSDNRVANTNQNEIRNETGSNRNSRSNSPATRNVDRVNNSELNNSPHNSPSRWSFSATWPRNFMFRRNNSSDRSQNENRSRNTTPSHSRSTQNTNNEQFNNQATRNFSATWPRNITYQRNMMSWQDNEAVGYLTTVVTTITTDSVSQSSSSQTTVAGEPQGIISSSSSEHSHIGQQRLVSPPGGFDFELNPAYQPESASQETGNCHTDHKGRMYCPNLTHCTKQCHKNNDRKKSQDNSSGWLNVDPHSSTSRGSSASTGDTSPTGALSQYGSQPELEFPSERSRVPPPTPEESDQPGQAVPYSQPSIPFDFPCVEEIDPQPSCSYANTNTDQEASCSSMRINTSEPDNYCRGRPPCTIGGTSSTPQGNATETGAVSFHLNETGTQLRVAHEMHSDMPCNGSHHVVSHNAYEQGRCMTYTYGMPSYYPAMQGCLDPRCMDPNCPNAALNGLPACGDPNCVDESCRTGFIFPCTDPSCTCRDMSQLCAPTGEQNMAPTLHVSTLPAYTIARPAVYGQSPTPSDKSVTFPGVEMHPRPSTSVTSTPKQGSSNTSSAKSTPEKSRKTRTNKSQAKKKEKSEPIKSNETDEERFNREQSFSLANSGGTIYEVEGSLSPSSPRGLFSQSSSVNRPETYGQDSSPLSRVIPFSEIDLERARSPKRDQRRGSKDKGKSPQIKHRDRSSSQKPLKIIENGPKAQKSDDTNNSRSQKGDDTNNSRSRKCEEVPCSKPQVDSNSKKPLPDPKLNPENSEKPQENTKKDEDNSDTKSFLVKARKSVENCNEDISAKETFKVANKEKNNIFRDVEEALIPNCKVEQVSAISSKNQPKLKPKPKRSLIRRILKVSNLKAAKCDNLISDYKGDACNILKNDPVCKNDVPPGNNLPGCSNIEPSSSELHDGINISPVAISTVKDGSNQSELCSVIGNESRCGTRPTIETVSQQLKSSSSLLSNNKRDLSCPLIRTPPTNELIDSASDLNEAIEQKQAETDCGAMVGNCDSNESSNVRTYIDNASNKTDKSDMLMIKGDVSEDKTKVVIAQNKPGNNKLSSSREILIRSEAIPRDPTDKDNMVYTFPRETAANNFKTESNSKKERRQNTVLLSKNNGHSPKDCLENTQCEFQSETDMSGEVYCDEFEIDYSARQNQYVPTSNTGVKSPAIKKGKKSVNADIVQGQGLITCVTHAGNEEIGKCHLSALNENVDDASSSHFPCDKYSVNYENVIISENLLKGGRSARKYVTTETDVAGNNKKDNKTNWSPITDHANKNKTSKNRETDGDKKNRSNKYIYNNNNNKGINSEESSKKSIKSCQIGNIEAKTQEQRSDLRGEVPFITPVTCSIGDGPRDVQVTLPISSRSAGIELGNFDIHAAEGDILDAAELSPEYRMGTNAAGFSASTSEASQPGKDHSSIIQRDSGMLYEPESGSPSLDSLSHRVTSRKVPMESGERYIYQDKSDISQKETSVKGAAVMDLNTIIGSGANKDLPDFESSTAESTRYYSGTNGDEQFIMSKNDFQGTTFQIGVAQKTEQGQKRKNTARLNTGIDCGIDDHSTRMGGLIGDHSSTKSRQGDNYRIIGENNRITDNSTDCHSNKMSYDEAVSCSTTNIDLVFRGSNPTCHQENMVKLPGNKDKTINIKSSKNETSDFIWKNVITDDDLVDDCSDQMFKCSLQHTAYKGDNNVCLSCDEDITPGTSDQSSPNLVGNLCTRLENVQHEATSRGCDFQCQNVHSTVEKSRACSSIVPNLSARDDAPVCTVNNCSQCARLSGNCVPTFSFDTCSLCPKYTQSNTSVSSPICSCGVPNCSQTVMSTGTPVQYLDLCYCPDCATVPNCSMCQSICSVQQSNVHNCSTSDIINLQNYSPSNSPQISPTQEMNLVESLGNQMPLYIQGLTQYSQSYATDCYGFTVVSGSDGSQPALHDGHRQGHEVMPRSGGSGSNLCRSSSKFTLEKLKHRSKEDLQVLLEQIRRQSQVVSEQLVDLLQERHDLLEQVEMRRVTIEQLVSMQGESDSSRPPSVQMSIILPDSESSSCDSPDDDR